METAQNSYLQTSFSAPVSKADGLKIDLTVLTLKSVPVKCFRYGLKCYRPLSIFPVAILLKKLFVLVKAANNLSAGLWSLLQMSYGFRGGTSGAAVA